MNTPALRLGRVPYINMEPIYLGLQRLNAPYAPETGVPTELNHRLMDGTIDVAPSSSIELAAHPGRYLVLPDVCVASDGAVGSALLLSRVPVERLDGRAVALTTDSATTVTLLQILARDLWSIAFEPVPRAPQYALDGPEDAALLIGDPALHAASAFQGHVYDLGAAWRDLTGLPMVFAVWMARRDYAQGHPAETSELGRWLARALAWTEEPGSLEDVVRVASSRTGLEPRLVESYFRLQRYHLDQRALLGLREFLHRAREAGAVAVTPEIELAAVAVAP